MTGANVSILQYNNEIVVKITMAAKVSLLSRLCDVNRKQTRYCSDAFVVWWDY